MSNAHTDRTTAADAVWNTLSDLWNTLSDLTTSDWISIAGTAIAVLGFIVLIIQMTRVATAVRKQRRQTAGAVLLVRTADLERIETEVRNARTKQEAERAITEWRRVGSETRTLLEARGNEHPDLMDAVSLSLGLVELTLTQLRTSNETIATVTAPILAQISRTCLESRGVAGAMMLEGRDE